MGSGGVRLASPSLSGVPHDGAAEEETVPKKGNVNHLPEGLTFVSPTWRRRTPASRKHSDLFVNSSCGMHVSVWWGGS